MMEAGIKKPYGQQKGRKRTSIRQQSHWSTSRQLMKVVLIFFNYLCFLDHMAYPPRNDVRIKRGKRAYNNSFVGY